ELDGFSLVGRIRRDPRLSSVPVIMLTSAGRSDDLARCRKLEVAAHLTKPVKQSDLFDAIADAAVRRAHRSSAHAAASGGLAHRGSRATAPQARPDRNDEDEVRPLRPMRVLLVEDNAVNREVAKALLAKQGHRVVVAVNGREAVDALGASGTGNGAFDLVLMDVQMPVMGGYEATTIIRNMEKTTGKHLPILAMTAHAMAG